MAKRTKSKIAELVERVSPGSVTLVEPRYAVEQQRPDVELTLQHRGAPTTHLSDSIEQAAAESLDFLDDPGDDPIVPHRTRLTRMQRELVVHTLREHAARRMARATTAKVRGSAEAAAAAFTWLTRSSPRSTHWTPRTSTPTT